MAEERTMNSRGYEWLQTQVQLHLELLEIQALLSGRSDYPRLTVETTEGDLGHKMPTLQFDCHLRSDFYLEIRLAGATDDQSSQPFARVFQVSLEAIVDGKPIAEKQGKAWIIINYQEDGIPFTKSDPCGDEECLNWLQRCINYKWIRWLRQSHVAS